MTINWVSINKIDNSTKSSLISKSTPLFFTLHTTYKHITTITTTKKKGKKTMIFIY